MTIHAMADNLRDIVNGAQLPGFAGKKVSIIGLASDVAAGGTSFNLRSTDNVTIPIKLKTPLTQPLEGYVEVQGKCEGKSILADDLHIFSNQQFDAKNYNALCKLLYSVPNIYSHK